MKKLLIFIAPLMLLFAAACEEKLQMQKDIYVNPDAEVCGVKDPMNNIPWLKDDLVYFENLSNKISVESFKKDYCIYADSVGKLSIVTLDFSNYLDVRVFDNCEEGAYIYGKWENPSYDFDQYPPTQPKNSNTQYSPSEPLRDCEECEEFFSTHKFIDFIARISYLPEN